MEKSDPPLSRLHQGKLTYCYLQTCGLDTLNDVKYLSAYWQEHQSNFTEFLSKLIEPAILIKLILNASGIVLKYVRHKNIGSESLIENLLVPLYRNLECEVEHTRSVVVSF